MASIYWAISKILEGERVRRASARTCEYFIDDGCIACVDYAHYEGLETAILGESLLLANDWELTPNEKLHMPKITFLDVLIHLKTSSAAYARRPDWNLVYKLYLSEYGKLLIHGSVDGSPSVEDLLAGDWVLL
jgi:hypothetical protein